MFAETFNGDVFVEFLKVLVNNAKGKKLFVILDNVSYHKSKVVQDWLALNSEKIELHFLPPYSPDLNAVEFVWRTIRRRYTHNKYFPTLEDVFSALEQGFIDLLLNPDLLVSPTAEFRHRQATALKLAA